MSRNGLEPGVAIVDASPVTRVIAYLVDLAVLLIPTALVLMVVFPEEITTTVAQGVVVLNPFSGRVLFASGAIASLFLLYFAGLEMSRRRGTLGKMLLTLRVVNDDLSPATSTCAAIRNLMRLPWAIPVLGVGLFLVDGLLVLVRGQRIGDLVAKTRVVKITGYWTNATVEGEAES